MKKGAIILCGGKSSRMGLDKATLPFGSELMLQRVIRLMAKVVDLSEIVVVAAPGQSLPSLPPDVIITTDQCPDRGPLEGLAAGLRVVPKSVEAVYATSCDVPLLVPAFVSAMFDYLGDSVIVVPRDGKFCHPLAAVYRPIVLSVVDRLLSENRLRASFLLEEAPTREIPVDELRQVDPQLSTLMNLNYPEDYNAALSAAGFVSPSC